MTQNNQTELKSGKLAWFEKEVSYPGTLHAKITNKNSDRWQLVSYIGFDSKINKHLGRKAVIGDNESITIGDQITSEEVLEYECLPNEKIKKCGWTALELIYNTVVKTEFSKFSDKAYVMRLLEDAFEVEKEQISKAWDDGNFLARNAWIEAEYSNGYQYYKEKYEE